MSSLNLSLCENRHRIPDAYDGALFSENFCNKWLKTFGDWESAKTEAINRINELSGPETREVNIFITGFTPLLTSLLSLIGTEGGLNHPLALTLYHYNTVNKEYIPQNMGIIG